MSLDCGSTVETGAPVGNPPSTMQTPNTVGGTRTQGNLEAPISLEACLWTVGGNFGSETRTHDTEALGCNQSQFTYTSYTQYMALKRKGVRNSWKAWRGRWQCPSSSIDYAEISEKDRMISLCQLYHEEMRNQDACVIDVLL
ncbi:hypothetical protein QTP86_006262 [Hemibagrus guttatus]|nr:hypothetical protein QTP86_006262 [Hemibagrus guttatus]